MKEKLGFNLAIMGMIASGKDTQVNLLKKKYDLKPVETGLFTRNLLKEKTKEGDIARSFAGRGKPLPVFLMKNFLRGQIDNKKNKDLIFVGGPRLKPEAQLVKKLLTDKKEKIYVIYLRLSDKEVYKRSLGRKNSNIKKVYKVLDDPNIIKERIKWHKEQVGKTVNYFKSLGVLKEINGKQTIEEVNNDIEKALIYFKKLNHKV